MTKHVLFASATFSSLVAGVLVAGCVDNSDCTRTATCPIEGGGGTGASAGGASSSGGGTTSAGGGGDALLALGEECSSGAICASSFCVDGVCCDGACEEGCHVCATGMCSPADPGTNPDGECGLGVCASDQSCATGAHVWSESHGGPNQDGVGSLSVDVNGNLVVSGSFEDTANFGGSTLTGSGFQTFVAKYSSSGLHLWSKSWDTDAGKVGACTDPVGNVFIGGEFKGVEDFGGGALDSGSTIYRNVFLVKLDPSGNHIWSKQFGTQNNFDDFKAIACDASGNVWLVGNADASHDVGATLPLAAGDFIVKFNPSGNHLFSQPFGTTFAGGITRIATAGNDIAITGNVSQGPHDLFGLTINDGRYLALVAGNGTGQWAVPGVGPGALAVTPTGDVVVSGNTSQPIDLGGGMLPVGNYVAEYDAAGNHVWSRGGWPDGPDHAAADADGNILLAGDFDDALDLGTGTLTPLGTDAFVAKLDGVEGVTLWAQQFGTIDGETAVGVTTDATSVFAIGTFTNSIDLGGGSLTNGAQTGIWLAAFEP